MRATFPFLLVAILVALPAASRADVPTGGPAGPAPVALESTPAPGLWYGWELMLSDTVFLLVANDGRSDRPELGLGSHQFALGLGGLVVGAPALHFLHGNTRRAAIGLGVRVAVVGLYALADDTLRNSGDAPVGSGDLVMAAILFGTVVGGVVFAVVDDIWHARVPPAASARPQGAVTPTLFLNRRGGGLGLAAVF